MVHRRSYWDLSAEIASQVKEPLLETARQWNSEVSEKETDVGTKSSASTEVENEKTLSSHIPSDRGSGQEAEVTVSSHKSATLCLQDRIARVAQKKAGERSQQFLESNESNDPAGSKVDKSSKYLKMVEELQCVNDASDSKGGKWLVR